MDCEPTWSMVGRGLVLTFTVALVGCITEPTFVQKEPADEETPAATDPAPTPSDEKPAPASDDHDAGADKHGGKGQH